MRSSRSSGVQSDTDTGGSTATSMVPRRMIPASRAATRSALRMTIGTRGTSASIAMRNGPFLNVPSCPVVERVPSGATSTDTPLRSSSVTGSSPSTAFALIRAVDEGDVRRQPLHQPQSSGPAISFLATDPQSRRTSLMAT